MATPGDREPAPRPPGADDGDGDDHRLARGSPGADDGRAADLDAPAAVKGFLVSGTSWAFAGMVASLLLAFAVSALGARLLEPGPFATFVLLISVAQALGVLGELGLPPLVTRELARTQRGLAPDGPRWFTAALLLVAASCLVLSVVVWAGGPWVAREVFADIPGLADVVGLVGLMITARAFERLLPDAFRGLRDVRQATIFGPAWTQGVATAALAAFWVAAGDATLTQVVVAYGLAGLSGAVIAAWRLRRAAAPLRTLDRPLVGRMLGEAWPVVGHRSLYAVILQADLWLVGALLTADDTALYGAALRIVAVISVPLLVVNQVVPPLIASMSETGETRRLERALRVTATLAGAPAAVILLALTVFGGPILGLVFGAFYRDAATILAVLAVGHLFNVWGGSCGIALMQTGHQRVLLGISAVSGVVLVAGAALVAAPFGTIGVAVMATASLGVQNWLSVRAVRRLVGVRTTVDVRALGPAVREGRALVERLRAEGWRGRGGA